MEQHGAQDVIVLVERLCGDRSRSLPRRVRLTPRPRDHGCAGGALASQQTPPSMPYCSRPSSCSFGSQAILPSPMSRARCSVNRALEACTPHDRDRSCATDPTASAPRVHSSSNRITLTSSWLSVSGQLHHAVELPGGQLQPCAQAGARAFGELLADLREPACRGGVVHTVDAGDVAMSRTPSDRINDCRSTDAPACAVSEASDSPNAVRNAS